MDDHGRRDHRRRTGTPGLARLAPSRPGGKALRKLRDSDASGKVEFWVHDDGTRPENPKASRLGPRWGLVQNDGRVLAVGILYASYLGGDEGYTASACDGSNSQWFDQLFWLGVNRAPAGWHKWTFDFDAEAGLEIFHNDRELTAVDPGKTGLRGFSAIAVWGDQGQGHEQPSGWMTLGHAGGAGEARFRPRGQPVRGERHEPGRRPARRHLHQGERAGRTAAHGPAPRGESSPSTESPGRSTSPPGWAISSTATGTSWDR